jgi:5-(aminomethyl)-3-furanmethanol phosphate kinase
MKLTIAKVGGSLFDLPDLRPRLAAWVKSRSEPVLLIPGGGDGADVIRRLDRLHRLGEEAAHWLALRVLTVNAVFLARLLETKVVSSPGLPSSTTILDPHAFCLTDEGRPGALGHTWTATSDAIAARVAEVMGAELVLLKSTDRGTDLSWPDAVAAGLVDSMFATVVARARLAVTWVNLRADGQTPG